MIYLMSMNGKNVVDINQMRNVSVDQIKNIKHVATYDPMGKLRGQLSQDLNMMVANESLAGLQGLNENVKQLYQLIGTKSKDLTVN